MYVLILVTMACLFVIQIRGSSSFNEVIYADSAVSDNMQLLEMVHNNVVVSGMFCGEGENYDRDECEWLKIMANDIAEILK